MKKFLVLIFGLILATNVFAIQTCWDTDAWRSDPFKYWGIAYIPGNPNTKHPDRCLEGPFSDLLEEGYCNQGVPSYMNPISCSETYGAGYVCLAGACRYFQDFTWCRFEHVEDICEDNCELEINGVEYDTCGVEGLLECQHRLSDCVFVPTNICIQFGGTPYNTKGMCEDNNEIPEFSAVAASIALVGAGAGFILLRKRR